MLKPNELLLLADGAGAGLGASTFLTSAGLGAENTGAGAGLGASGCIQERPECFVREQVPRKAPAGSTPSGSR